MATPFAKKRRRRCAGCAPCCTLGNAIYASRFLPMTPADGDCPLARAMRETLDAVVTPVVREALIHDALILAGLSALPERRDAMRAFAGGHLRAVVARA